MQIRISPSDLVDPLVRALNETDCVATRAGADAVGVSVPWSGREREQARMEVLFFVRSWGLPYAGFDARLG